MPKTKPITRPEDTCNFAFTGDAAYAAALDRLARQERRSRASLLEFALSELARTRGIEMPDRFANRNSGHGTAAPQPL